MKRFAFIGLIVLLGVNASRGQLINGSLENTQGTYVSTGDDFMELAVGSTALPGWTVVSDSVSWLPNGNPWILNTPFDTMLLDLTGSHDNGSFGGIAQVVATLPFQTYRLSLSLGAQQDQSLFSGPMSVVAGAGGSFQSFTFTPSGAGNQWATFSFDFVATSGSTLLTITGAAAGGGSYLGLDNIQLEAVPEPSTLPVLAWGAMIFLARRWKSR